MVIVLGVAAGLVMGVPLPALAAMSLSVWQPLWAMGTVLVGVGLTAHRNRLGPDAEAAYLQGVAGELRAGSSLRYALSAASSRSFGLRLDRAVRLAAAGQPLRLVADALEGTMPRLGALTASAVRTAGATGGRAADVFDALALLAAEEVALVRERRAATAQARFSAWIVGGIPVVYLLYAALAGKLAVLQSTGSVGRALLVVGSLLLVAGVGLMWGMLRTAER